MEKEDDQVVMVDPDKESSLGCPGLRIGRVPKRRFPGLSSPCTPMATATFVPAVSGIRSRGENLFGKKVNLGFEALGSRD